MEGLYTEEGIAILSSECVALLQDALGEDHCLVDTIVTSKDFYPGELKEVGGKERFIPFDGVKHFNVSVEIGEKENTLDFEEYSKEVLEPGIIAIASNIKDIGGEYALVPLYPFEDGLSSLIYDQNVGVRVTYGYNKMSRVNTLSIEICMIQIRPPKVFLGGTCNESKWRNALIHELKDVDYFNPVVEDWTEECMAEERKQRKECDYCLYVITPRMTGCYSIAEVVQDACFRPEKTIFCVTEFDQDFDDPQHASITYDDHMKKSLKQVSQMVQACGTKTFQTLQEVANFLNK